MNEWQLCVGGAIGSGWYRSPKQVNLRIRFGREQNRLGIGIFGEQKKGGKFRQGAILRRIGSWCSHGCIKQTVRIHTFLCVLFDVFSESAGGLCELLWCELPQKSHRDAAVHPAAPILRVHPAAPTVRVHPAAPTS